jgi:hypothetical protein
MGYARIHKPDGILSGLSNSQIAVIAGWDGDADEYIKIMIEIGILDETDSGLELHNWRKHNPYAANQDKRSAAARTANEVRWGKAKKVQSGSGPDKSGPKADPPPPSPLPSPSPSPPPSPKELADKPPTKAVVKKNPDHKEAIEYFCTVYEQHYQTKYVFNGGKDGKLVSALLKKIGLGDFKAATDQMFRSTDQFFESKAGRSIGVLSACINKIRQEQVGGGRQAPSEWLKSMARVSAMCAADDEEENLRIGHDKE